MFFERLNRKCKFSPYPFFIFVVILPAFCTCALALSPKKSNSQTGLANGGPDIVTYVGVETEFAGWAISPDKNITKYEWDFDGDAENDFVSGKNATAFYSFGKPGKYRAIFKAYDDENQPLPPSTVKVIVRKGKGKPTYVRQRHLQRSARKKHRLDIAAMVEQLNLNPDEQRFLGLISNVAKTRVEQIAEQVGSVVQANGAEQTGESYVVMINGGGDTRYWDDIQYAYDVFTNDYNIPDEYIYLLNYNGSDPDGNNPGGMIDYSAEKGNIELVFEQLGSIIDPNDLLYIWVTDHGRGYSGPNQHSSYQQKIYGYLDGIASIDPGDEEDYLESDFKLRSLFTGGQYIGNHGMNQWKVYYKVFSGYTWYYRHNYVTTFSDVNFVNHGLLSDSDIYIEELKDYLAGDYNKDGKITDGEVIDFDGDGNQPYNNGTQTFDPDDWGLIDTYTDNVRYINTQVPYGFQNTYHILDLGSDGLLDIDLDHDPDNPESNGTDMDNNGLFDGMDINDDKDKDDFVSIDETLFLPSDDMTDDKFAACLAPIQANVISITMLPCFSGGFIEDLSGPGRIIMTSCEEETVSYGDRFLRNVISALSGVSYPDSGGDPTTADTDMSGDIDMVEVFNYAAENDYAGPIQIPQYDDNSDTNSTAYPIPLDPNVYYTEEGWLGNRVTLTHWSSNPADFDADGDIDCNDLGFFSRAWLWQSSPGHPKLHADLFQDDQVNLIDFAFFNNYWQP